MVALVKPTTSAPSSAGDTMDSPNTITFLHQQQSSPSSSELKHISSTTPSPSPSATSTSFNLLGVDGLPVSRVRPVDSQFTPAPLFSLARASSLRYPGWKPPNSARGSSGSDTRRNSLVSPPPVPPLPSHATSNSEDTTLLSTAQRRFTPAKPLSPNHLAKIANAFGVQVPTTRSAGSGTNGTQSIGSPSSSLVGRPGSSLSMSSGALGRAAANTPTRFLLTVIPPAHLSPEYGTAHGPPAHFRRGTLIPLHATLPSQLAAIAREYSLPSTIGLVVYLLDVKHDLFGDGDSIGDEWLGPRITEEAWKMLWTGMLKAEREELARTMSLQRQAILPSVYNNANGGQHQRVQRLRNTSMDSATNSAIPPQSSSPSTPTSSFSPLGSSSEVSSPSKTSPQELKSGLKPLFTEQALQSGPSSASGSTSTSTTTTNAPSLSMTRSESPSSIRTTTTPISPFLPSLPIVGKIEFDIDRSRAGWYELWAPRSRSRADAPPSPLPVPQSGVASSAPSPGLYPLKLGTSSPKGRRAHPPSPLQPTVPTTGNEGGEILIVPGSSGGSALPRNSLLLGTKGQNDDDDIVVVNSSPRSFDEGDETGSGYEQLDEGSESGSEYGAECQEAQLIGVQTRKVLPSSTKSDEHDDDEDDENVNQDPSADPLAGVFPSDQDTWSGMAEGREDKNGVIHSDRAGFLGSEDNISGELPIPESSTDDFQEVLNMLNVKRSSTDVESGQTSAYPSSHPSFIQAPPTLGSPIVLQEKQSDGSRSPPMSPGSVTSMDSKGVRRPAPLVLAGASLDLFPPVTGGLGGFTPIDGVPKSAIPYLNSPGAPVTPMSGSYEGTQPGGDSDDLYDEFTEEQAIQKQLDALEKTLSQRSPRDLAPTPEPDAHSPMAENIFTRRLGSVNGTPLTLNGIGGPRFRSEALGAELAVKIAEEREGKPLSSIQESRAPSPNWPAVKPSPAPIITNTAPESGMASARASEETPSRLVSHEDDLIAATKKYRPPTPGNRPEDSHRSFASSASPPRISTLPSPKSSRFSADSAASDDAGRSSIMSRSIRKLWRKTGTTATAVNKLNAGSRSSTQLRGPSPPPPLPSAPPLSASYLTSGGGTLSAIPPSSATSSTFGGSRASSRPDSGLDPFHFDQESRYSSLRSPSPTTLSQPSASQPSLVLPSSSGERPASTSFKTRSILKGRKTTPPTPPSIIAPPPETQRGLSGFFSRAKKSSVPPSPLTPGVEVAVSVDVRQEEESRPSNESSTISTVLPPGMPKLHPTGFPKSASRSSFDLDDGGYAYRPSVDSGVGMGGAAEPVTPRFSQFEIVSPPMKSFDLEDDDRRGPRNA